MPGYDPPNVTHLLVAASLYSFVAKAWKTERSPRAWREERYWSEAFGSVKLFTGHALMLWQP